MIISYKKNKEWFVFTLCLCLASSFWFLNRLNNTFTTSINYPVKIIYNRYDFAIKEPLPEYISLRVNGSGWKILPAIFNFVQTPITINNPNITNVNYLLTKSLTKNVPLVLQGLQIQETVPDTLYFSFEKKLSKQVPVVLDTQIIFTDNFSIAGNIVLEPDTIWIFGAYSLVNPINFIKTKKIELTSLTKDYQGSIALDTITRLGINYNAVSSFISIPVAEFISKTIPVKIKKVNFPEQYNNDTVNDYLASVSFKVLKSKYDNITSNSFEIIADYRFIEPENSRISIQMSKIHPDIKELQLLQPYFYFR